MISTKPREQRNVSPCTYKRSMWKYESVLPVNSTAFKGDLLVNTWGHFDRRLSCSLPLWALKYGHKSFIPSFPFDLFSPLFPSVFITYGEASMSMCWCRENTYLKWEVAKMCSEHDNFADRLYNPLSLSLWTIYYIAKGPEGTSPRCRAQQCMKCRKLSIVLLRLRRCDGRWCMQCNCATLRSVKREMDCEWSTIEVMQERWHESHWLWPGACISNPLKSGIKWCVMYYRRNRILETF